MRVYANGSEQAAFRGAEMADDGQSLRIATKKKHQIYIYITPFTFLNVFSVGKLASVIFNFLLHLRVKSASLAALSSGNEGNGS